MFRPTCETATIPGQRGSGTRTTLERLHKDAGLPLRIGSEMSSNEAIKQMCAAGFGAAFLSLHTCGLELRAGLLALLPMAGNPLEREWHAMHLASRRLPQVASAFKQFLADEGQRLILEQLRMGADTRGVTVRASRARTAQARNVRQKGA